MWIEDKIMMDMVFDFERVNEVDRELDFLICKLERGGYVKDDFYIIILIFKSDNCDFRKYYKINKKWEFLNMIFFI